MANQPLAEVFGFPISNLGDQAARHRQYQLCPFNNKSTKCTKSSVEDPLGVCSVYGAHDEVIITCPVRFREDWVIVSDAAAFFFPPGARWSFLTEVKLNDVANKSAGNIDIVLLSYDANGSVIDYGALEVQAVYISGNVRTPFDHYMASPLLNADMDWRGQRNYSQPDYLSSSRKRLAPQLIFKGGILNAWNRKMAVALSLSFFRTLPVLDEVSATEADIAWFIYDLEYDDEGKRYRLKKYKTVYTNFEQALIKITRSEAGNENVFLHQLQARLSKRLDDDSDSN